MGKRLFLIALLAAARALTAELTEARIFEWWDDGIVTPEEADEMLALMDEGDMREACALAEVYAGEACDVFSGPALDSVRKHYSGHYIAKLRFDSSGALSAQRHDFEFEFRRLTLKLGAQELLTYKSKRGEAHFGQISTRELHSEIPLDTLWGAAIAYALGKFRLSAMLDTSRAANFGLAAGPFSKFSAQAAFWAGAGTIPATSTNVATSPAATTGPAENAGTNPASGADPAADASANAAGDSAQVLPAAAPQPSASLTLVAPSGKISAWYQAGQSFPLVRFSFQGRDAAFSWSTTGYIHGDSVPAPARLSPSILKNSFWSTQNVSFRAKEFFDTKATASARVTKPLHSDSISGRLSLDIAGGPEFARPALKFTCVEAASECDQALYQANFSSSHAFGQTTATLSGGARTRHERSEHSWQAPRLEIAIALTEKAALSLSSNKAQSFTSNKARSSINNKTLSSSSKKAPSSTGNRRNSFRISFVAPEARPDKKMQIRTETRIYGDHLEFSLTAAFQRSEKTNFHPTHAQVTTGFFF
ncbi:MAG: hypothetical protein IK012_04820 [Fibrobacter sp.]|uniref:hypothetical protein n=1 Tax=Fibrobacter sp. TaxID=35828 RepID=UPI0025BB3298|nr:hypothetical protein [Fibrobacter sp.]MBR4784561.1 hypothetical protein [Fibrobacter sp.]